MLLVIFFLTSDLLLCYDALTAEVTNEELARRSKGSGWVVRVVDRRRGGAGFVLLVPDEGGGRMESMELALLRVGVGGGRMSYCDERKVGGEDAVDRK